jgi:hypothetical protein
MSDPCRVEHSPISHDHDCGNLFGCGDEKGTGVLRQDLTDSVFTRRAADRLWHMAEVQHETVDKYITLRGRLRRQLLRASGFLSVLAVQPWVGGLACADDGKRPVAAGNAAPANRDAGGGRIHVVESSEKTVSWGVFDTTLPPILTIESNDLVVYPNTWSHFFNQLQPGVPIDALAQLRKDHPGRGPHSIIGPIAVRDAEPGDVLEIRYKSLKPFAWGAVFNNPGALGTGLLPEDFPQGQVKYLKLNVDGMTAEFLPKINVPLQPFQGTLGLAPPDGFFPPVSAGVTSSVPPGPHAGNLDLRELTEGSKLFIPVWKPGALIYTGDSPGRATQAEEAKLADGGDRYRLDRNRSRSGPEQRHDPGRTQCHPIPRRTRWPYATGRLCAVQHRSKLPSHSGGGHRPGRSRADSQEAFRKRIA